MMNPKSLAAKTTLAIAMFAGFSAPSSAGIPVIDGANWATNMAGTYEEVLQTLKQIEEFRTQLSQYENQLQNTLAPAVYLWDEAQNTINSLMAAVNTLDNLKRQLGSLDGYLSKFQDINYYRSSPCFTARGCSASEMAALTSVKVLASESIKKANDALFKGLDQQQANLSGDSLKLKMLQTEAQGATGQMQAIGFANQLASQQANQLLQIRGLLIAQQNSYATKMQGDIDKDAQTTAADEQFKRGTFRPSSGRAW